MNHIFVFSASFPTLHSFIQAVYFPFEILDSQDLNVAFGHLYSHLGKLRGANQPLGSVYFPYINYDIMLDI